MLRSVIARCSSCRTRVTGDRCGGCGGLPDLFEAVVLDEERAGVVRDLLASYDQAVETTGKIMQRLRDSWAAPRASALVALFCEQVWLPAVRPTVKQSTYVSYRGELRRHLYPRLGEVPLGELSERRLTSWLMYLSTDGRIFGEGGLAPRTVNYIRGLVHRVLDHAVELGYLTSNPCLPFTPKAAVGRAPTTSPPTRRPRSWSDAQLDRFLDHTAGHELAAAWRLVACAGLQRSEVLGLRWSDFDLAAGRLRITRTYVTADGDRYFSTPRPAARRTIRLDNDTVRILEQHRDRTRTDRAAADDAPDALAFARPDGAPLDPDVFSRSFAKLVEDAGLPHMRLSDLRHLHARQLLEDGADPDEVATRLGHASGDYTLRSVLDRTADSQLPRQSGPPGDRTRAGKG